MSTLADCRTAIVGGGILGMTLALRLQGAGRRVTVIEGSSGVGGLVQAQRLGGYTWDRFYHVILLSDSNLRALLEELGLGDSLHWATTRTGFYTDGRLHSLSSSIEFLRFGPLSLADKLRLAATVMYAARVKNWRPLEAIPVEDWLRRLSGSRTVDRIWLPLLRSKLGDNYRQTSAAFIWATIARMYAARRTGLKREMFGYVDGGYDAVLRRFQAHLEARGVEIVCGDPVRTIRDAGDGVTLEFESGRRTDFDKVLLTTPCGRIPQLVPQLSPAEKERLGRVVYQGIVCAAVLLRRPLAGFYITNITEPWVPFTAVIEMTNLVDRARFGGNALVYLPRYLAQNDPCWARSDQEIRSEFLAALTRMYPAFRVEDVMAFEISRVRQMLAVTTLNYSDEALPPTHTSLPNVFVVNSAQIANGTLNVNETVGLANAKARELAPRLQPRAMARLAS